MSRKNRKAIEIKRRRKAHNKSKLEKKIWEVPTSTIQNADNGRFLPYCTFNFHEGVIKEPEVCEERECRHYYKLYFPDRGYGKL